MMLTVDQLSFGYKKDLTIENISFTVSQHDVLTVLGPNGAGKTTLIKCINHILTPKSGSVVIGEDDTRNLSPKDIARKIGYVSQRGEISRMTVYDLILIGRRPYFEWNAGPKDFELTAQVIELMGLSSLAVRYADELSGGELQLVQIARALVQQPHIMLLDEPTNNLDIRNQHRILSTLWDIVRTYPMMAVMAVHDVNLSIRFSNKFILLKEGSVYAAGGREIITPETMHAVYDIEMDVEEFNGIPLVIPR